MKYNFNDMAFVHRTTQVDEFSKNKMTKVELAVLMKYDYWKQIRGNIEALPEAPTGLFCPHRNALQILAQRKKQSCDKYTEVYKKIVSYSGAVYLVRIYKIVGEKYLKLEITKVPLGIKKHMNPKSTIGGLSKLMKKIVQGYEKSLLPHYFHRGVYQTTEEFLIEHSK